VPACDIVSVCSLLIGGLSVNVCVIVVHYVDVDWLTCDVGRPIPQHGHCDR